MRSLLPRVMRPKSIATVVDALVVAAAPASSMPSEALVMAASVVSGSISEIEPTKVVLPTANPPATTIFTGTGTFRAASGADPGAPVGRSESLESIQHPFQEIDVGLLGHRSTPALEEPASHQVAHQHSHGADHDTEVGRDLGQRDGGFTEREDSPLLEPDL